MKRLSLCLLLLCASALAQQTLVGPISISGNPPYMQDFSQATSAAPCQTLAQLPSLSSSFPPVPNAVRACFPGGGAMPMYDFGSGYVSSVPSITIGSVTALPAGSVPSVSVDAKSTAMSRVLDFGIPAGPTGAIGATPQISIGTVVTGLPGSAASVTLDSASTTLKPVFDFVIPQGAAGTSSSFKTLDCDAQFTFPSTATGTIHLHCINVTTQ
jgi:hypothetical protein